MRFVTFEHRFSRYPGVVQGDAVVNLGDAGFGDLLSVVRGGAEARAVVDAFLAGATGSSVFALESVRLCAPLPNPGKILCVGLNYRDHAAEARMEIPAFPTIFAKYPNTIIGPGEPIVLPKSSQKPDYEAEFALVIGKRGRYIREANWREHVFGYMNFNDVSARDFQMAVSQWTMGKNFDGFASMGPFLVSADEIEDPHNLEISLTVDSEKRQHSNTRELIFKIPALIEFLSGVMTLEAGDVISTGTPAGVGMAYNPPKWLTPGAEVIVEVEGLGQLRNTCVAE